MGAVDNPKGNKEAPGKEGDKIKSQSWRKNLLALFGRGQKGRDRNTLLIIQQKVPRRGFEKVNCFPRMILLY